MFTVCGTCHGRIHHIPRPLCLSDLVKAGQENAKNLSPGELREVAEQMAARAEKKMALAELAIRKQRLARLRETLKAKADQQITIAEDDLAAVNPTVPGRHGVCENPPCDEPVTRSDTGRRKRFCTDKCRREASRHGESDLKRPAPVFLAETPEKPNDFKVPKASKTMSGEDRAIRAMIKPDDKWPGMFRVQYPAGLSDMVNWSRAYDAGP
jgi:hypothetical protein